MFQVPKPGHNQWRKIIDIRELNRYCSTFTMTCETLKHLRQLSAPAGGVAAAAPERGALAGPSAPTSTSTWWALVTP
jgi:hypothetical protein